MRLVRRKVEEVTPSPKEEINSPNYMPLEVFMVSDPELFEPVPNWNRIMAILVYRKLRYGTVVRK